MANSHYDELIERKQKEYGPKFDASDLVEIFKPFLRTGQRIKVKEYGKFHFGTVGITTGWKPVFLLMHNERCHASGFVIGPNTKLIAVQNSRGQYIGIESEANNEN